MKRPFAILLCLSVGGAVRVRAGNEEPVDWGMMTRIRQEGLMSSKVMETLQQLTDVLGPRLTGSPNAKRANEWTRKQLEDWGLANAHLESYGPFGRGWSLDKVSVQMTQPAGGPLLAYPKSLDARHRRRRQGQGGRGPGSRARPTSRSGGASWRARS